MSDRKSWLSSTGPQPVTRQSLASSLRPTGASVGASWLKQPEAPREAAPAACQRCAELDELKDELTMIKEDAAETGRQEGLAETASLRAKLTAAVSALANVKQEREAALTEIVVDVALGLCQWLAPAAAAIDRRGLAPLVHQALAAGGGKELTLRLNPDDAAELGPQVPSGVTCEVVETLAPGEVVVEAPRLVVDARWPTRLAALREPLLAMLKTESLELSIDDDRPASSTLSGRRIPAPTSGPGGSMSGRIKTIRSGS